MNPPAVPDAQPLGQRLLQAPAYPFRGAGLAAFVALSLAHAITDLLPGWTDYAGGVVVWASILMYAMECLRHTADGFAEPPEVAFLAHYGPAVSLLVLQGACFAAAVVALLRVPGLWAVVLGLTLVLPAIAMSLAFEDHLLAALNPVRWGAAIGTFGLAYLLPVTLGLVEDLFYVGYVHHDGWLGKLLLFTAVVYLCLTQFHVLGLLMHHHHETLGHEPESDKLAEASGRDKDTQLLDQAGRLVAQGEHEIAETLLRERLREKFPPLSVFDAHRRLLRHRGDRAALLHYAHVHMTRLLAEDQPRPALGLARECIELDPDFMPDQPRTAARLADAAHAQGMNRLALKLARGYPNTWPGDPLAPRYGLLAARLLDERFGRTAEAGVLASKLLEAFPQSPQRPAIEAFMRGIGLEPPPGEDGP